MTHTRSQILRYLYLITHVDLTTRSDRALADYIDRLETMMKDADPDLHQRVIRVIDLVEKAQHERTSIAQGSS